MVIMIFPQDDEDLHTYQQRFYYKAMLSDLDRPSPSLPMNFDRSYLPKNICEKEFAEVLHCLMVKYDETVAQQECLFFLSKFDICKKKRNMAIFESIKEWESRVVAELDKEQQQMYVVGLNRKLERLKAECEAQSPTEAGEKQEQIKYYQIAQMAWRMKYINKIINTL